MRLSRLLIAAPLALAPTLAMAQGAAPPIRLPRGSTGPADGLSIGGLPLAMLVGRSAYQMPMPTGSATADAANFAAGLASTAPLIVFQAAPDSNPYKVPPSGYAALGSGKYVAGQGPDATIIRAAAQTGVLGMLNAVNVTDVGVSNLTLDYADFPAPSVNGGILVLHNAKKVRIANVNLLGWPVMGLSANGGSDVSYRGGRLVRTTNYRDTAGNALPIGRQTQCVVVSSSFAVPERYLFEDMECKGAGFDTAGKDFKYVRTSVNGWSFGGAYTIEQEPTADNHLFQNVTATIGRTRSTSGTNPQGDTIPAGYDDNNTSMVCIEAWASRTVVDGLTCDDTGGDGIALGGKNSRVVNSRITKIGMQIPSYGIKTRIGPDGPTGLYTATGSLIANNTVVNSNGTGDGSSMLAPYGQESTNPAIVVTLAGNDFGVFAFGQKGQGERWAAPGLLVSGRMTGSVNYTSCSTQTPVGSTIVGARRQADAIVGATFVGDSGATLTPGVRVSAQVNADNSVVWSVQDTACSGDFTVPVGTFYARLITIN